MFHAIKLKRIDFSSNPKLPYFHRVEFATDDNGSPVDLIVYKAEDNRGVFMGSHYDPSSMSLRARLNRGVRLQTVNYDITENDPNKLASVARSQASAIIARSQSRKTSTVDSVDNPE